MDCVQWNHFVDIERNLESFKRPYFGIRVVGVMDHAACHVVYVDKRSYGDRYEKRAGPTSPGASNADPGISSLYDFENKEVKMNLENILSTFHGGTRHAWHRRNNMTILGLPMLMDNSLRLHLGQFLYG